MLLYDYVKFRSHTEERTYDICLSGAGLIPQYDWLHLHPFSHK